MTRLFVEDDFMLRVCSTAEIGQPWEDRWSINDFLAGSCDQSQVGISRHLPVPPEDEVEQSELDRLGGVDKMLADFERDHTSVLRYPPNIGAKLLELSERRRQEAKAEKVESVSKMMTRERLAAMTTHDIKEYIIKKADEQGPQPAAPPASAVANALLPLIPAERQDEAIAALKAL